MKERLANLERILANEKIEMQKFTLKMNELSSRVDARMDANAFKDHDEMIEAAAAIYVSKHN